MMKKLIKRMIAAVLVPVICVTTVCGIALVWYSSKQNQTLITTAYTVEHAEIPEAFDGKKIVHLTDLHNKDLGDRVTDAVKAQHPDIIVVTGDWIGRNDTEMAVAKRQMEALVPIAPIYYVAGNHEAASALWNELRSFLEDIGVCVLENDVFRWTIGEETVQLIGVFDPEFGTDLRADFAPMVKEELYSILLYHRPEQFEEAVGYGADLLLCGHTHGGQIRLPFIGAVFVPHQYWFPKYDVGRFSHEDGTMIVSQGLGESVYMRILTPPEMVVVTLKTMR